MYLALPLAALVFQSPATPPRPATPQTRPLQHVSRANLMAPALTGNHILTTGLVANSAPPASDGVPQLVTAPGMTLVDAGVGGHDQGWAVASDGLGSVYAVGRAQSSSGYDDILTVKLDASGGEVWQRTYAGSLGLNDRGWHVALDPSGNVIVAGGSAEVGSGVDMAVLKYDPQGNLLWTVLYNGPGNGFDHPLCGRALAVDSQGNALVGGRSWGGPATQDDGVLLKIAPDGTLVWERRYDGATSEYDEFYCVEVDDQDHVYVGGDTSSAGSDFILALKYDPAGTLLWERQYDGPDGNFDLIYDLSLDPQNNVLVAGLSTSDATGSDFVTVKYDTNGNLLWARHADGGYGNVDFAFRVGAGPNGDVAVVGITQWSSISFSGWLLVYDATGNLLWEDRVGGGQKAWLNDAAFTSTGELLVGGLFDGFSATGTDGIIRRYAPGGVLLEERIYDNPCHASDGVVAVEVDSADDVFGVGASMGPGLDVDLALYRFQ